MPSDDALLRQLLSQPTVWVHDVDDDGRVLVSTDTSGSLQLHEIGADGTWRQLTDLGESATGRYLPGTRSVVVQHDSGGNERGQLSLLDIEDTEGFPELRPLVHDPDWIHGLSDTKPGKVLYKTNRRNGVDFDLISREIETGEEQVLYDGGGWVMEVSASPDERWVAFTLPTLAHSLQLVLVSTADGTLHELTSADEPTFLEAPSWLPDSSGLLVATNADREFTEIRHYDLDSKTWTTVLAHETRDLVAWSAPTGKQMFVATNDDGVLRGGLHDIVTGADLGKLDLPAGLSLAVDFFPPRWSPSATYLTMSASGPRSLPVVVRHEVGSGATTPIPLPGSMELPSVLVEPESVRVPTPDGEQVPVFVYRPAAADGSVVILVHGGPEGQSMRNWAPIVAAMVAQGHTVLVPNVRGSTGYGKRWYALDDVRLRLNSVADLAALHEWLPTVDLDPSRAALYGGSYGGYMVLAGLAFQPERWAAGVDIVGIASLVTFLENTSDFRRAHREREYGSLEHDRDFLESASPISRVDEMRAPLFVIHGANDVRVPLSEAEQIAEALRKRDVPCELRVYDDEGHGLKKKVNQLDAYPAALAFLAEQLAPKASS
ncbi:alpha/beta fold hydrolase [Tenggerimyces flavus]|uniref:S9 family peptidase n=1 Tax=Tenggerimyces flavus TaxID=1708749 RepID=A0ABV7YG95_9ACTN|nr:alpha/beta fold hydrolase [Tenggerimyces flavus]MBM7788067.1 dipeptidyl aminopeptidase/acylaminoacyl peptidase [Tenggerimyces flavus]